MHPNARCDRLANTKAGRSLINPYPFILPIYLIEHDQSTCLIVPSISQQQFLHHPIMPALQSPSPLTEQNLETAAPASRKFQGSRPGVRSTPNAMPPKPVRPLPFAFLYTAILVNLLSFVGPIFSLVSLPCSLQLNAKATGRHALTRPLCTPFGAGTGSGCVILVCRRRDFVAGCCALYSHLLFNQSSRQQIAEGMEWWKSSLTRWARNRNRSRRAEIDFQRLFEMKMSLPRDGEAQSTVARLPDFIDTALP